MSWNLITFSVGLLLVLTAGFIAPPPSHGQVGVVAADIASGDSTDAPDDSELVRTRFIEYERQLNAMLKTRREEEQFFVGSVVNQIRLGNLPSKLVSTSFEWVRNKRPDTEYPFVYFERVLRLQATRLNLESQVPEFDFRIYSQLPEPVVRSETIGEGSIGNAAITQDGTATERNNGFDFFRRAFTRVVPVPLTGSESPDSDNAETERTGGAGIFRVGDLVDRFLP